VVVEFGIEIVVVTKLRLHLSLRFGCYRCGTQQIEGNDSIQFPPSHLCDADEGVAGVQFQSVTVCNGKFQVVCIRIRIGVCIRVRIVSQHDSSQEIVNHLRKTVAVRNTVDFKHIEFNVKLQAPFLQKKIIMLVGGTAITPMIEALHAILGGDDNDNEVVLFYGSRTEDDILGRTLIDSWAKEYPDRLKVVHVLSDVSSDKDDWKGRTGYITKEVVEEEAGSSFGPECGDDVIVFVCGPPPMYNAICGPRGDDEIKGLLAEMGYKKEQVYKF